MKKLLSFYLLLNFINYFLTQSDFEIFTTYFEIFIGVGLFSLIFAHFLNRIIKKKEKIPNDFLLIIMLLLLSVITTIINKNRLENLVAIISFINQTMIVYLFIYEYLLSLKNDNAQKFIAKNLNILGYCTYAFVLLNIIVIIANKYFFVNLFNTDIISIMGRYSSLMVTPAFLSSLLVTLAYFLFYKFNWVISSIIVIAVSVFIYISCESRSGSIAVVVFLAVLGLIKLKNYRKIILSFLLGFLSIILILGLFDISELYDILNETSSDRLRIWIVALKSIVNNLLFGIGPRNIGLIGGMHDFEGGFHNSFIQIFATNGIIFFVLVISLIFKNLFAQYKFIVNNDTSRLFNLNFAFCISFICYNMVESHMFFIRFHNNLLFWLFLTINRYIIRTGGKKYYENISNIC